MCISLKAVLPALCPLGPFSILEQTEVSIGGGMYIIQGKYTINHSVCLLMRRIFVAVQCLVML